MILGGVIFCLVLIVFTWKEDSVSQKEEPSILKVGFPAGWGDLVPPLQHTVSANMILSNEFEPLVQRSENGILVPLAASSWTISPDFRTFTFQIDQQRKFSDGTPLRAVDFKESWEQGLLLAPKSKNRALLDVMGRLKGFDHFERERQLEGVRAPDEKTLILTFRSPFRAALDHLQGGRFAAFLVKEGKYFGTGPYRTIESNASGVSFQKNPCSAVEPGFDRVEISAVEPDHAQEALLSGAIDVHPFGNFIGREHCDPDDRLIGCLTGREFGRSIIALNNREGHLFSRTEHRQALQALLYRLATQKGTSSPTNITFQQDFQVYLPFQAGRLPDEELKQSLEHGSRFIDDLIAATQKTPIHFVTYGNRNWVLNQLRLAGVTFTKESGFLPLPDVMRMFYGKTKEPDVIDMGISVWSGDPDGLYHALGLEGAILSPMTYREEVGQLLEQGREITELKALGPHYQKVSRAILREVPFVHLGFSSVLYVYRKDHVQVTIPAMARSDYRLHIFEPRS